jgi:hypothetical protein
MEQEDWEEQVVCIDCGASLHPETDAGFPIDEATFLCNACAIARGGVYDPVDDRWVVMPVISDAPDERRPHP